MKEAEEEEEENGGGGETATAAAAAATATAAAKDQEGAPKESAAAKRKRLLEQRRQKILARSKSGETVGALGVALKCFRLVDYFRSFPRTASLVWMVSVILTDMVPFTAILIVVLVGATLFFTINSPSSEEFALDDEAVGPFRPLLPCSSSCLAWVVSIWTSQRHGRWR